MTSSIHIPISEEDLRTQLQRVEEEIKGVKRYLDEIREEGERLMMEVQGKFENTIKK